MALGLGFRALGLGVELAGRIEIKNTGFKNRQRVIGIEKKSSMHKKNNE